MCAERLLNVSFVMGSTLLYQYIHGQIIEPYDVEQQTNGS